LKKIEKKTMTAQINIAIPTDIADIDALNRQTLAENYSTDWYQALIGSPQSCCFVVRVSEKKAEAEAATETIKIIEQPVATTTTTDTTATQEKEEAATADTVATTAPSMLTRVTQDNANMSDKPIDDAEMAGYILTTLQNDFKGGVVGNIVSVAVASKYRRHGFATTLLQCAEGMLKEKFPEIKYIMLHVRKQNKSALKLYAKNGYNRGTIVRAYYSNPVEDAFIMKKPL
jgi:ribosomal protein S18 acetylase RimI-like enzyme